MVREKQMAPAQLLAFGAEVVARCRRSGAQVVVNSDAQVAQAIGADGLHLPSALLMAATVRPPFALCGASCHDERELRRAAELDLDYVMLGPVLPTASHPQARGARLGGVQWIDPQLPPAGLRAGRHARRASGAGLESGRARHRADARAGSTVR